MKKMLFVWITVLLVIGLAACGVPDETTSPSSSAAKASDATTIPPSSVVGASTIVTFADPALEAMVRGSMGKPAGNISVVEAESVTRLDFSNEWQRFISEETAIHDIGGLEFFKNLESLDLSFNAVADLTPLSGLKKLASLSLGGNPIKDLAPLAGLTNLKVLTLSGCAAQNYSLLSELVNLNLLMLDNSTLTDVSPLVSLTKLKGLYLAGCSINNYFPLSDLYQTLEQKDFTIAFTLSELGFIMDNDGKQAIYDGDNASVRINHIEWGAPPEEWLRNCVRTVFAQNDYKIDIGYYPKFDAYVIMAHKDSELVLNYVYDHTKGSSGFSTGDRERLERTVRAIFTGADAEDILYAPVQIFKDILAETIGITVETLFEMPFDEADDTLPSPYEKLGFVMLDYKGTCLYEEQTPHTLNISIHRTEWDENVPAENRVDWSMELNDSDVNGYKLQILYYAAEGRYHVSIEKDGEEAAIDTCPAKGERGGEWPDLDTAHRLFNDAFGTKEKELYDKTPAYFEQIVQERFGMSIDELYALPAGE